MKAEDLMIGDLVYYSYANHFVTRVIDVCCHGEEPFIRCKRNEKDGLYKQGQLEDFHAGILRPIILTEEILKKNGFYGDVYLWINAGDGKTLEYYPFKHRLSLWYGEEKNQEILFKCHCFYVHELQHALKLCGIEKEIIL